MPEIIMYFNKEQKLNTVYSLSSEPRTIEVG